MFLDDAELRTESWLLRHSPEAIHTLGVWRWKGMQRNMERILSLCVRKRVIDFGGVDGPLGLSSIVVDCKADNKTLDDVAGLVDVVFTSHCLEHCERPELLVLKFAYKLISHGAIIVHVPAWTCTRWRADSYHNDKQQPHLHTFGLLSDAYGEPIDSMVATAFEIQLAEHCGDNSLMVIGRKR